GGSRRATPRLRAGPVRCDPARRAGEILQEGMRPMATLLFYDSDGIDKMFELTAEPVLLGRATECTIQSSDPRVSRRHARILWEGGYFWVEDLGSANGVYVGGQKVQKAPIPLGETIVIGSRGCLVLNEPQMPPDSMDWQLVTMLKVERRARAGLEEERDALGARLQEISQTPRPSAQMAAVDAAKLSLQQEKAKLAGELTKLKEDL